MHRCIRLITELILLDIKMSLDFIRAKIAIAASNYNAQQRSRANQSIETGLSAGRGLVYNWAEFLERSPKWKKVVEEHPGVLEECTYKFPERSRPTNLLTHQEQLDIHAKLIADALFENKHLRRENDALKQEILILRQDFERATVNHDAKIRSTRSELDLLQSMCESSFPRPVNPISLDDLSDDTKGDALDKIRRGEIDLSRFSTAEQVETALDKLNGVLN